MGNFEEIPDPILGRNRTKDIFTGSGIISLNGLTNVNQTFAVGTAGSNFNILSSGSSHIFNLPTASTTNRGALSSADWDTFTAKENALTFSTGLTRSVDTITTNDSQIVHDNLSGFVANEHINHSSVNINTISPLQGGGDITASRTLSISQAGAGADGYLSSTDWNTFNNKFDLPSLTSGSVLFSNGTTIAQDNTNFFWDNINKRLGIGLNTPSAKLDVNGKAGNTDTIFCVQGETTNTPIDASNIVLKASANRNVMDFRAVVEPQNNIGAARSLNNVINIGGTSSNNITSIINQQLRCQFQDSYGGAITNYDALKVLTVQNGSSGSPTISIASGLKVEDLSFASTNYGTNLQLSSGVNKWNVYAPGTADNYLEGDTGFGLNNPSEKVHSSAKVRADTVFNLNGTDGVSGSFTTTDAKTVTVTGGIITAIV
jgi:hypothetical protein